VGEFEKLEGAHSASFRAKGYEVSRHGVSMKHSTKGKIPRSFGFELEGGWVSRNGVS
jgi:hypothetical protein